MFGEIKKMLGIEDAKITIKVPEKIRKKDGPVNGTIVLTSMTNSEVTEINIKLIEWIALQFRAQNIFDLLREWRGKFLARVVIERSDAFIVSERGVDRFLRRKRVHPHRFFIRLAG